MYVDEISANRLDSNSSKVILIGSYFGTSNFGDILQLKGAIKFHKKVTGLEPVVILDTLNLSKDVDNVNDFRKKLEVETIIFIDKNNILNISEFRLQPLRTAMQILHLHLYGGGFMNKYWGGFVTSVVEYFHEAFKVKNYIISGQQVSQDYAKEFIDHCSKLKPLIVGVRDYDSLTNVENSGINVHFSFDDALEELLAIKVKVLQTTCRKTVLLHMNASSYTSKEDSDNSNFLLSNVLKLKENAPSYELCLLNAYNDQRYEVSDTMYTLVKFEDKFPYATYRVLDLTKVAYDENVTSGLELLNAEFAVSSSYHVTLLLQLIGVPCHLISSNEFYDQKRASLSVKGTLEEFLANPKEYLPDYNDKLKLRREWLLLLQNCFVQIYGAEKIIFKNIATKEIKLGTKLTIKDLMGEINRRDHEIESYYTQVEDLAREVKSRDHEIESYYTQVEDLAREVKSRDHEIESYYIQVEDLSREVKSRDHEIKAYYNQVKYLSSEISTRDVIISEINRDNLALKDTLLACNVELQSSQELVSKLTKTIESGFGYKCQKFLNKLKGKF
jgi:hypothetical protein